MRIVHVAEAPELPDPDPSVDQRLVVDEMNVCVRQVIDSLPEDYRVALVLHDLEGLTVAQVAQVGRCSCPRPRFASIALVSDCKMP